MEMQANMTNDELRKANETIEKLNASYRAFIARSTDAILILDRNKAILFANAATEELFGENLSELPEKLADLPTTKDEAAEITIQHGDGEPTIAEVHVSDTIWEDKNAYILSLRNVSQSRQGGECSQDIAKRELAEEALRETEEKYRILTNILNIGVYRNTPGDEGKFIDMNTAHTRIFGYRNKEELLSANVSELYQYPEDRKRFSERLSRVGFADEELKLKKKDGTLIICQVTAVANRDEEGNVLYFDGIVQDISERKQREVELQESREKYRVLVENANEAVLVAQDGMLKFVNHKAMEITGHSESELTEKPFADFIHPDDREIIEERYRKRVSGEELPPIHLFRIIDRNKSIRWMEINSALISWMGKSATLSMLADITERRRTEEALKESEKKYRLLVENANASIVMVDLNGIFTMLNNEAAAGIGGKPGDFIGKSLYDVFPEELANEYMKSAHQVAESRKGLFKQSRMDLPAGEKWFSSNVQPIVESDSSIFSVLVISQDITEYKQADQALQESLERENVALKALQESREREMLALTQGRAEIVDTILHNIGNAINSVTIGIGTAQELVDNKLTHYLSSLGKAVAEHQDNFSDYVANDTQGQKVAPFIIALADDLAMRDEKLAKSVNRVSERAEHISEVIRTMRSVSSKPYRKDIVLKKAIADAVTVLQDSVDRRGIVVITDCDGAPEEIRIQESQFHQMLVNFIKNSIEAIDDLKESEDIKESLSLFRIKSALYSDLNAGNISEALRGSFKRNGLLLSGSARISLISSGNKWLISDKKGIYTREYTIEREDGKLYVYLPFIKIKCYSESGTLILQVIDSGIGIEQGMLEIVFRSKYTTKETGTGLGLHSAANFVKGGNGHIQALSDGLGKGATMRVELPLGEE